MVTRAKVVVFKPKVYTTRFEPASIKKALQDPQWLHAMKEEFSALIKNQTWTLVELPFHKALIDSKWVFHVKYNLDGSINKYKAHLVAKGYRQQEGYDFHEMFSPVVKPATMKMVLTIALSKHWPIHQTNFNNAFLNTYMRLSLWLNLRDFILVTRT